MPRKNGIGKLGEYGAQTLDRVHNMYLSRSDVEWRAKPATLLQRRMLVRLGGPNMRSTARRTRGECTDMINNLKEGMPAVQSAIAAFPEPAQAPVRNMRIEIIGLARKFEKEFGQPAEQVELSQDAFRTMFSVDCRDAGTRLIAELLGTESRKLGLEFRLNRTSGIRAVLTGFGGLFRLPSGGAQPAAGV